MPPHGTLWQNAASRHLLGSRPRSRLVEVSERSKSGVHSLTSWGWYVYTWSLTWNLKINPWKRRFLLETIIFRFHVNLQGCIPLIIGFERETSQVLGFPWDFWTQPSTVLLGYPFCNLSCGQYWQCLEITSGGWWLNQPIWKICSSNWKSSPN